MIMGGWNYQTRDGNNVAISQDDFLIFNAKCMDVEVVEDIRQRCGYIFSVLNEEKYGDDELKGEKHSDNIKKKFEAVLRKLCDYQNLNRRKTVPEREKISNEESKKNFMRLKSLYCIDLQRKNTYAFKLFYEDGEVKWPKRVTLSMTEKERKDKRVVEIYNVLHELDRLLEIYSSGGLEIYIDKIKESLINLRHGLCRTGENFKRISQEQEEDDIEFIEDIIEAYKRGIRFTDFGRGLEKAVKSIATYEPNKNSPLSLEDFKFASELLSEYNKRTRHIDIIKPLMVLQEMVDKYNEEAFLIEEEMMLLNDEMAKDIRELIEKWKFYVKRLGEYKEIGRGIGDINDLLVVLGDEYKRWPQEVTMAIEFEGYDKEELEQNRLFRKINNCGPYGVDEV